MEDLNFLQKELDREEKLQRDYPTIYIVEDDVAFSSTLKKFLQKNLMMEVECFQDTRSFVEKVCQKYQQDQQPFCLLTDISLDEGGDGLILIDILSEKGLKFLCIAMTGFASIESAIAATKKGVFHYLTKPFELKVLSDVIKRGLSEVLGVELGPNVPPLRGRDNHAPCVQTPKIQEPRAEDIFYGIVGRSSQMKDLFDKIRKVAASESTVLISGPSGTGKELVAQAIHNLSPRCQSRKISVNCGAIPAELLESELFGHVKGSFTGAISNRKGRFELADGGSIFLDEIGDMPFVLQVKLLRVLQNRQIEPIGSESRDINVRVIAATHQDLEKRVNEEKFREDLYYRLNVIPIKIPALKERKEDIPLLIGYFLNKFVSADRSNQIHFSDESLEMLISYDWPGNVRELENVIERLVILKAGSEVTPEDLPVKVFQNSPFRVKNYQSVFELPDEGIDLKKVLNEIEDSFILQAMEKTDGNKNRASKLLKMNRTTLIEKMKKKSLL